MVNTSHIDARSAFVPKEAKTDIVEVEAIQLRDIRIEASIVG